MSLHRTFGIPVNTSSRRRQSSAAMIPTGVVMLRSSRAALYGAALMLSALVFTDAAQAAGYFTFDPPPGMSLTDGKPKNGLQLKRGKVKLDPRFMRQVVAYETREKPGTIVVVT